MLTRFHILREVVRPAWTWVVLIPLTAIGFFATIRDELIEAQHPELYRIAHVLPWAWQTYALIPAFVVVLLVLAGAYRAIKKRDDLMLGLLRPKKQLHSW
jgi:hypothetical protein